MATVRDELDITKLDEILELLNRHQFPNSKWPELGISLGLKKSTVEDIRTESIDHKCLKECLSKWLQKQDDVVQERRNGVNCESLADALKEIQNDTVAQKILTERSKSSLSEGINGSSVEIDTYYGEALAETKYQSEISQFVAGIDHSHTFNDITKADEYIDDIVLYIDVSRPLADYRNITLSSFKQMVLNDTVPVTTSLIVCMGLPRSGKSSMLEKLLQMSIQLKQTGAKRTFADFMGRKEDKQGLTLHELCILGRRGRNAWSFATKRYGAIFSVLCDIVRQAGNALHDVKINIPPNEAANLPVLDVLYQWLLGKVKDHLDIMCKDEKEEIKLSLLHDGISLVNVMDIGVNKALLDFLPMLLLFCRNYVRCVNFSLERDGPNLYKKPDLSLYKERSDVYGQQVMRRRTRITYLLRFVSIGHQHHDKYTTIMMATDSSSNRDIEQSQLFDDSQYTSLPISSQKVSKLNECRDAILKQAKAQKIDSLLNEWQYVDLHNDKSIEDGKNRIEQFLNDRQADMPLKWIILRSLMVSLTKKEGEGEVIILRKKNIEEIAKQLGMDQKEVMKFLNTFTNFGSILYMYMPIMPSFESLKDIVIVNIWKFVEYLTKLYYPSNCYPDLCKYGYISQTSTKKILGSDEEDFMQIMITLSMVARIPNGKNININGICGPDEMCYYLPFARTKEIYVPTDDESDFAFLEIQSPNFPANIQASIAGNIINALNDSVQVVLVLCEETNVTRLNFEYQGGPTVSIEMVYQASRTRIRVTNGTNDILSSPEAVDACSKVLNGCCKCLKSKKEYIPDLTFSVGIYCSSSSDVHYLYSNESIDCTECHKDMPENLFRQCWMKAVAKCSDLTKDRSISLEKALSLEFYEMSKVAKEIAQKSNFDEEALARKLEVTDEEHNGLEGYEKSRSVMSMLMIWEKRHKGKATKGLLAKLLKELNYEDIATMLIPPTTAY